MAKNSVFWNDLHEDLEDPKFRAEFEESSRRIREWDRIMNDAQIEDQEWGPDCD